ncbi:anti-sigma factor antagonist [uncultured Tyzzerella sp.]|uniref:STAS domain-containing protein n=1 Tax=uncultured Tyzzerella sp. TaxID=2321398 RepID=UPI002941C3FE|nr:anti-sigma factor antagonist [uncultured Tyzzerella sp.]
MKIECKKINRTLLVKLYGEIDHHYTEDIRDKIDREFNKQVCNNIILDFEDVGFMDSSGIGMIIGRYKMTQEKNGKLYAFGLKDNAKRIFDISGLNKLIVCFTTKEEAIKSI